MGALSSDYIVRPYTGSDMHQFAAIELAAARIIPEADLPASMRAETVPVNTLRRAGIGDRLIAAEHTPTSRLVGFALILDMDDVGHLHEMDVLPEHGRRGLGGALIEAVVAWAREQQRAAVTLTTFDHLPWNRPFYERHGFRVLGEVEITPALRHLLDQEEAAGLDRSKRVAMRMEVA